MNRGIAMPIGLLLAAAFLGGCTQSTADFRASIEPNRGHVPFEATITATDIGDSYTFYLPDETITQASPTLDVTVDALDWKATIETTCGGQIYTDDVHATGSNAPPAIYGVKINGIANRWYLVPLERTLLEFDVSPGATLVDVEVWGSQYTTHYTVFIPPYDGTYHAIYGSRLYENACIVYPMYKSIPSEDPSGLPYAPTELETGYPYVAWTNTNVWDFEAQEGLELPQQTGTIRATAEDELGQKTTETFTLPILARDY